MMSKNSDLAIIHIAKKQLGMNDDDYRDLIRNIGKARSGSSKDLSDAGRARVLEHMKACGFKKKRKPRPSGLASSAQVRMIHRLWHELGEADVYSHRPQRRCLRGSGAKQKMLVKPQTICPVTKP
ncbi:MAG: regulatory protein GemA [Gammaproteobacteria bacterium]|nr:regulatory protein GemA [Gammaproteobacteria bacterium]